MAVTCIRLSSREVRLLIEKARYTEPVSFREDKRIFELAKQIAEARGSDVSAIYREAIRHFLARMGLLDKQNLRILEGTE
jgi:SpoVK/Ycf46/Vps4 family AAA+-type ATPase